MFGRTVLLGVTLAASAGAASAAPPASYGYGRNAEATGPVIDLRAHLGAGSVASAPTPARVATREPNARLTAFAPAVQASDPDEAAFAIQLGAFAERKAAERVLAQARAAGPARIEKVKVDGRTLHRVHLGAFAARSDAETALANLAALGFADAIVARLR